MLRAAPHPTPVSLTPKNTRISPDDANMMPDDTEKKWAELDQTQGLHPD